MYILFGSEMMAETVFIPILYIALLAESRSGYATLSDSKGKNRNALFFDCFSLVLWVFLSRIRVVGIPFMIVFLANRFLHRRYYQVFAGILLFAAWMILENSFKISDGLEKSYTTSLLTAFPVNDNFWPAISILVKTYAHNIWSFAGSMYASMIFPFFYQLHSMNLTKRLLVLTVFMIALFGFYLLWRKNPFFRPVLLALVLSWIPVFSWPTTGTIFRYMAPFFPFLLLFLIIPFYWISSFPLLKKKSKYVPVLLVIVFLSQLIGERDSVRKWGNETGEDYRDLHQYILNSNIKPDAILSQTNFHYTYLKTGIKCCAIRKEYDIKSFFPCLSCGTLWGLFKLNKIGLPEISKEQMEYISLQEPPLAVSGSWALYDITVNNRE
jgi:hypothetical protein